MRSTQRPPRTIRVGISGIATCGLLSALAGMRRLTAGGVRPHR